MKNHKQRAKNPDNPSKILDMGDLGCEIVFGLVSKENIICCIVSGISEDLGSKLHELLVEIARTGRRKLETIWK